MIHSLVLAYKLLDERLIFYAALYEGSLTRVAAQNRGNVMEATRGEII
jgi:hypothetical protein